MSRPCLGPKFCFLLVILIVSVSSGSLWGLSGIAAAAQPQQELHLNPEAESWVLEQIEAGQVADLREYSPNEEHRVLSADFIEEVLAGELADTLIHRHGVRIEYAIFTESIDLANAEIPFDTRLTHCRFQADVDLSGSHFRGVLSFDHSTFSNASKEANFRHMTVEGAALYNNAIFEGEVDFGYSQIGVNFEAIGAEFRNTVNKTNFACTTVGYTTNFRRAIFKGPVDFRHAEFRVLIIDKASWSSKSESRKLDRMTYEEISIGDSPMSWEDVLLWVDKSGSAYSAQPYAQLEAFFRAEGYPERADAVFAA